MQLALASLGVFLRLSVAVLALGSHATALGADSQQMKDYRAKVQAQTDEALAAIRAKDARRSNEEWARRNAGPDFDAYGTGDNRYSPSSGATRRMSRDAPPPPGTRWVAMAQQAWKEDRDEEAADYLQRASQAGNAGATRILGIVYETGLGVAKDADTAIGLYRKAAAMGDDDALLQLGRVYALGIGAVQDYAQSIDWYTKASRRASTRDQGDRALLHVRRLRELDLQIAAAETCEKTGNCGAPPKPVARPTAWTRVTTLNSVEYYADWASVSRQDGRVQISELMNYAAPQRTPQNVSYRSMKVRKEYDCQNNTVRWLSAEGFEGDMGRGGVTVAAGIELSPSTPAAGSAGEALQNSICGR